MKQATGICIVFLCLFTIPAISQEKYQYSVDLVNVNNDQVYIELVTPVIREDKVIYSFPKAVPGSYSNKDFGRFISSFSAFDKDGKKIKIKKLNENQYQINKAKHLFRITYRVEDTWDHNYTNFVFQPGGTNIDAGNNFVINTHAFFGYLEGYKMLPIELNVIKPEYMYGATNMQVLRGKEQDVMQAQNYNFLADNPILYARPDTSTFTVGDSKINIAVYSATGKVTGRQVADYLKPMSVALEKFFNGLPVKSYQFLFYFEKPSNVVAGKGMGGFGALEHNYSSLYFLPEISYETQLKSLILEVASHEFLHILTPLNLHSKEIGDFDFINPQMSKHLWLYEGVTEYFAHLVQLQNGIITEEQFIKNMQKKIARSKDFLDFSMTEMSKNVLTEQYKSKYESVYTRGALIAWMLDIFIRDKTGNNISLKDVIMDLSKKYGPDKPFNDETFFDEFVLASHPEVKSFIEKYIEGIEPLPLEPLLQKMGYDYINSKITKGYYLGNRLGLKYDEKLELLIFTGLSGNVLDIKNNDALLSVNDTKVTVENLDEIWSKFFENNISYPELFVVVLRDGKEIKLSGKLFSGSKKVLDTIELLESLSTDQQKNRLAFLLD